MPLFQDTITGDGIPLADATCTIYDSVGALATLYSDMAMSIPLANPITSDVNGLVTCYMANGNYQLIVEKAGYSQRTVNIGFFPVIQTDYAERTVNADFIISINDSIIWVDAIIDVIGTFPNLADVPAGIIFTIKNKSAFNVNWLMPDGKLLNDAAPAGQPLTMQGEVLTVSHDGIGWQSI